MDDIKNFISNRESYLYKAIEDRMTSGELTRIKEAFLFACEAHGSDVRQDGKPYITHPLEVACIIGEELQLGSNTIIAALLHDVVEDTQYKVKDIQERFGSDVAFLVKVVTKQKKENNSKSKQSENFKQILDSVHYDIRAILVKLADRLHNMRTLSSLHANKQMRIAGETDYFYAPLANKLGLYTIKTELQNLSLQYRCPQEYAELENLLKIEKAYNKSQLDEFTVRISKLLTDKEIPVRLEVSYRTPYSLWLRMKRSGMDFKHIGNKYVIWIIYPNDSWMPEKHRSLQIYSILTDVFKEMPNSMINYIDSPKENGYQSLHIKLLNVQSGWEDVHISSERMIRNSKLGCVAERKEQNIKNWISKFKKELKEIELDIQEERYIENVVSNLFNDDIRVYSRDGDGVILPQRATALDFAYEIHTDLGNHAQCARINGKLCSIKTILRRGDRVEIVSDKKITPKADWINYVKTHNAKYHIQSWIRKMKAIPYGRCLTCNPLPGDEVIGFRTDNTNIAIHKRNCSEAILLASSEGDSIVDVNFNEDMAILYPVCIQIKAVDRLHLLRDMTDCVTEQLNLSISNLTITTLDEIVDCTIHFSVHSARELQAIIKSIYMVKGVDEVRRMD